MGEFARRKLAQEGVSVPQSTEEEAKQPRPVFVIDDEIEESGSKVKKNKTKEPPHKPQFVKEVNKSKISSAESSGDIYEALELNNPLTLLSFRDFEGRVKKLVF